MRDSGLVGAARSIARRVGASFKRAVSWNFSGSTISARLYVFGESNTAIGEVIRELHPRVSRLGLRKLSEKLVAALKLAVDPITRTGRLKRSFGYDLKDNRSDIYTTVPYGVTLLRDRESERGAPTIEALREWAARKPELASLDERERTRALYAIRRAIMTGNGLGRTGRSAITSLPPSGRRAYDYREVAINLVERSELSGNEMSQIWGEILDELD